MTISIPGLDHLSDDTIFDFCSKVVFIPWIVLALAPKWGMRRTVVYTVVLIQCIVYALTFASSFGTSAASVFKTFADLDKLEGVIKLFANDAVMLPAWVHYLAFDLVVGNHLVEKNLADPAGLHQALMFPVLFFTFMSGPVGVLLYAAMSTVSRLMGGKPAAKAM